LAKGGSVITKGRDKRVRVNQDIKNPTVRVINDDGEQLGVLNTRDAINMAHEQGLDLVEVSPNAEPPVCRVMDFGKFKYQQAKRKQEAKKKQTSIQIKEVKLRLKTETHDMQTKMKHVIRFIKEGDKVKISIVFRGREITHPELAVALFQDIIAEIGGQVAIEAQPRMEGRAMVMMVGPRSDG
jgi:translation initiation factor IF-3